MRARLFSFVVLSVASAQGVTAAGTIVAVDREALAARIFSDATPGADAPVLSGSFVSKSFERSGERPAVEVASGLFTDSASAARAMRRPEPSVLRLLKRSIGDDHFLSARFLHARFDNLVVAVEIDQLSPGETVEGVAEALARAISDPDVAKRGPSVNTPAVTISSWEEISEGHYRVVFTSDAELPARANAPERDDGLRELGGGPGWMEKEFVLRVARLTGEIAEVPASKFPPSARRQGPAPKQAAVTPEARQALLELLREKGIGSKDRSQAMLALAGAATEREIPEIMEYLANDEDPVVRKHALHAVANVFGGRALDTFRNVARSANQPEVTRRDAVRLIGAFGGADDAKLLRDLLEATRKSEELQSALREALRRIEGVPVKY